MRYMVPILIATLFIVAIDYYVYRNWRRFAREGPRAARWTLPVYRVLLWVMPLALPLYFYLFRWWEVEPRLARALFFAFLTLYYLPKVPIAVVLLVKDASRLAVAVAHRVRGEGSMPTTASHADVAARTSGAVGRSDASPELADGAVEAEGADARSTSPNSRLTTAVEAEGVGTTITRSDFLRRMGWSAAAVPFVLTGMGVMRTVYDFAVHRVDVPIAGLPRALEGLTIAQLSDLHAGSLFSDRPMWDAVAIVNDLRPDVIALTGDYVNNDDAEMPPILPALRALQADLGVYACLGNHEHYARTDRIVDQIGATPIDLLVNEHRRLDVDGARLYLIGTDNTGLGQRFADLPRAVEGIEPDDESTQILLAHDPTFWDLYVRPDHPEIDLMLGGHTHGGQFGFEFGPLRWSLAQLRYERWAGLYTEPRADGRGDHFLYVNRGIGTVGPALRLGIRPEVTLVTLRRA